MFKTAVVGTVLLAATAIYLSVSSLPPAASPSEIEVAGQTAVATRAPLYKSSVVGTDFDFITDSDPSAFGKLEFKAFEDFEMPDKRDSGEPLVQPAYVFLASYNDGSMIRLALDKDFGSEEAAREEALRYAPRLGKLPALYRKHLRHLVVHKGGKDTTAFAEDKGHFFVIYSENATKRIATRDLEETFFHEGTHATIQDRYLTSAGWKDAVARDGTFVTDYASTEIQEDFAESALFAYGLIFHPDRIPPADRARIEQQIPNRIEFFRMVFTKDQPLPE